MPEDLCLLPAVELARRLRVDRVDAGQRRGQELPRGQLAVPLLNAMVTRDDERAHARATELDEALVRGGQVGPLHGLPVAHKDLLPTAGLRTTCGSTLYARVVPAEDAVLAQRVRAAGGIRVGKTNVPEFGAGSHTTNALFGPTRNPYDPSRTPGGSSGGAAVALATGMAALADGSDMGGSLRNPASFCNVVGLRPSPGRVPSLPSPADLSYDVPVLGPMGRSAADAALLLAAVAGPHPGDPLSAPWPAVAAGPLERDLRGVRVAWGGTLGLPFQREVLEAFDRARPGVEQLGVSLTPAEPDVRGADEVFRVLRGWHMARDIGPAVERAGDVVAQVVRDNVAYGRTVTAEQLAAAQQRRRELVDAAGEFFRRHDYLVMPVSQLLPFDAGLDWPREAGGEPMPDYLGWMRSAYLLSVLRVPAASVPAGFTPGGLPVGLQVVGRTGDDLGVLQVCHALEQVFGAGDRHPDLAALTNR